MGIGLGYLAPVPDLTLKYLKVDIAMTGKSHSQQPKGSFLPVDFNPLSFIYGLWT